MNKGQNVENKLKKILKAFKMNEDTISTLMGGVVILVIAGLIFNYFKSANIKTWQGMLLDQQTTATTTVKPEDLLGDKRAEVYKVVKGDNLWRISEKFYKSGYNYVDIMKENRIGKSGVITAGMELKIPNVEAKKITVKSAESKKDILVNNGNFEAKNTTKVLDEASKTSIEVGTYTIKRGDSLWDISVRAYGDGFKWTKIYWANRKLIGNPDVIHAGVKIVIPTLDK